MHSIQIHEVIGSIISLLYLIGVWHRGDEPTVNEMRLKFTYCIHYVLFSISTVVGAITNDRNDMSIFLAQVAIAHAVLGIKCWLLIWKQHKILDLLNRVCVFTVRNEDDYSSFNEKLKGFMKFVLVFLITVAVIGFSGSITLSLLGTEKSLFVKIAFPLDYRNNGFAFWIATIFIFTAFLLGTIGIFFSIIIWYLLLVCSLRYEGLGSGLRNMGRRSEHRKGKNGYDDFREDLKTSVNSHIQIMELTDELESFFTNLFFIQFSTSGLCICGSIYCLASNIGDTVLEHIIYLLICFYCTAELFMITYMGNEIMLSSNRLSYSLFQSDWYNQPPSTRKKIVIFGEYLKQPKKLLVGKLYSLTLETFTRILNSAYSMFNILQRFQQ
ncbi:odorant receptor 94b-like [Bradysia coprophila]|uniref:odorant receptor 94b-like n=1 Tax=Bradysia coprophila TaxID=38358 RepID=UPI00187DA2A8|nr:odorant receptor 94b-like [Bradysia coprophila]